MKNLCKRQKTAIQKIFAEKLVFFMICRKKRLSVSPVYYLYMCFHIKLQNKPVTNLFFFQKSRSGSHFAPNSAQNSVFSTVLLCLFTVRLSQKRKDL
ncbi:MAG TPA: hypothetical protein DCG49_08845 [Ruminococcus sp.]|nr:hypothetical protein [Ruminococcus sp.]